MVITGEGRLDLQTLEGKAPAGIARVAISYGKRVYAIVGQTNSDPECRALFDGVYELVRPPITSGEALKRTAYLLQRRAQELGTIFLT